jgi:hypothetical protein
MPLHPNTTARIRLSIAYLLAPCFAMLPAAAAIMELRVGKVPWWISNLPFWIGLASSPGYVYVWTERWRGQTLNRTQKAWIYVSLGGATLASVWASLLLLITGILWILPAICAALGVQLWLLFTKGGRERF